MSHAQNVTTPRRRWIQRTRNLLAGDEHIVAQVHRGSGTVGLSVAGGPTVVLEPSEVQRLRALLAEAGAQALTDRGGW
ncbi:hypothetical protein PP1_020015 [Pseudonocardia sp. P1]